MIDDPHPGPAQAEPLTWARYSRDRYKAAKVGGVILYACSMVGYDDPPSISDRMHFSIVAMRERGEEPRAVYLSRGDMALFENELDAPIGGASEWFGISVRITKGGAPSKIYSTRGLSASLRKRLK